MERDLAPLPAAMASIIGRESEIAGARRLIEQDRVRLVTLTGPAGVGKTRLAIEVAAECAPSFDDRVSFIPLATLTETSALLGEIASAFGVPDSLDPVQGLRRQLHQSTRLLVLDNLEQLPGAGAELARLLRAAPGLTILATSRSPLEMYGEYVFPIDPLPVPAREDDLARLSANPAIRLLVDSSLSANAMLVLPRADYPLLAEIARRVDGLPLALELAGAYIPLLGVRGVLRGMDNRFAVLDSGPRDLPARLRTMRDAIAWSYDLLTPEEQALFRRLSVFTGGFTFDMAEAMARGWRLDDGYPYLFGMPMPQQWLLIGNEDLDLHGGDWCPQVLSPIAIPPLAGMDSLVKQNLVRPLRSESSGERFELLETIRDYGLEQLASREEAEAARHAHAVLLMGIAELNGAGMWGAEWRPAAAWAEAELPNFRSAIAWLATQPPDANQLRLRLIEGLWPFWQSRGYASEGCTHLEAALASPGGTPGSRTAALSLLGALSWIRNDPERAAEVLDEALPILQQMAFDAGLGRNFLVRALVAWSERDFDRVEKMAQIARKHFGDAQDFIGIPMSALILGIAARARNDRVRATAQFEAAYRGLAQKEIGGFVWGMGVAQYYLGEIAREEGDRVRAVSNLREALQLLVSFGDPWTVGGCVGTLAGYLVEDGELEEAARLLGASDALESSTGVFLPPTETAIHKATVRDVERRIGPDAVAALFAEGRQWSMEEAAARAMRVSMESAAERAARLAEAPDRNRVSYPLSERSLRTLRMLIDGYSVQEIAIAEGIGPSSAYERLTRMRELFGLPPNASLGDLRVFAVRNGIV